jgi:beta-lactam-binding protein with PASTA domain
VAEPSELSAVPELPAVAEPPELSAVPELPAVAEASGSQRRPTAARAVLLAAAGLLLFGTLAVGWLALGGRPSPDQAETGPAPAQPLQSQVTVTVQPLPKRTSPPITSPQQTISETISPKRTSSPAVPRQTARRPAISANAVGSDVNALQERLKGRGYEVKKVVIASAEPKDSVVGTIPGPGVRMTAGQTVVVVASKGEAPKEPSDYVVPGGILGSQTAVAEQLLKVGGVEVKKVGIASPRPKDTIVGTYPAPGKTADAGTVVLAVSSG